MLKRGNRHNIINFGSNNKQYLYAPAIVLFILTVVYCIKGIFPFGSTNFAHTDMGQQLVPAYYHLYDALHGNKSLFFDWYTACGTNMIGNVSMFSMLSPLNLFFYLIPRDMILQFMSVFTLIKMMLMSLTMFIFINKSFKIGQIWKVAFAVYYAFSGFSLQYYIHSMWLDFAIVFPLLILAVIKLYKENKLLPYIILLTLCLIMNIYISFMVLLFLFFTGGLYILLLSPKDKRGQNVLLLGLGTFISLGLSAFISVPAFIQMSDSARVSNSSFSLNKIIEILKAGFNISPEKFWMLIGTSLAISVIILGICKLKEYDKETKKKAVFLICSILFVAVQIVLESVNLIWHTGSYVSFPMRFGFMVSCVLIQSASFFIEQEEKYNIAASISFKWVKVLLTGLCITLIAFVFFKTSQMLTYYTDFRMLIIVSSSIIFFAMIALFILLIHKGKYLMSIVIQGLGIVLAAILFLAPSTSFIEQWVEHSSSYVEDSDIIYQEIKPHNNYINRYKNIDAELNSNYPLISATPAISNWMHMVSSTTQNSLWKMGYSKNFTRLLDSGGTVFTDALLNIKKVISTELENTELYSNRKQLAGGYSLYDCNYTLPLGIVMSDKNVSMKGNSFEIQNSMFNCFSDSGTLIETIKSDSFINNDIIAAKESRKVNKNERVLEYNIDVKGHKILYFKAKDIPEINIFINGNPITVTSINRPDNKAYPVLFNNNLIELGTYENETVNLKLSLKGTESYEKIYIGLLDLDKFKQFIDESNSNSNSNVSVNKSSLQLKGVAAGDNDILFLPVLYDEGWSCTVNGQNAEAREVFGTFIGIPLNDGINDIEMRFTPKGLYKGIAISISSFIIALIILFLSKKQKLIIKGTLSRLIAGVFTVIWLLCTLIIYLVPFLVGIVELII